MGARAGLCWTVLLMPASSRAFFLSRVSVLSLSDRLGCVGRTAVGRPAAAAAVRPSLLSPLQPCPPTTRYAFGNGAADNSDSACFLEFSADATVADALHQSVELLQRSNTPEPIESAVQLLSKVLRLDWNSGWKRLRKIVLQHSSDSVAEQNDRLARTVLTPSQIREYARLLHRRRTRHEPIQYLVGQWDFLDHTFLVRPPLLCPRPETEELVLLVRNDLRRIERSGNTVNVLDVGCGTGCIGLSIHANVTAIDPDPVAVRTSRDNAERIGRSHDTYRVFRSTAADFLLSNHNDNGRAFDLVVSNPPYIPASDMSTLDRTVVEHESPSALCGGIDGLDVVRDIIRQLPNWCRTGAVCWMEVDPTHPALIRQLLRSNGSVAYEQSQKDMFGRERFVKLSVMQGK